MREVLFKDLTSIESRKKDIFLKEVFEKDGVIAKTERRCFYFIKSIMPINGAADLEKWAYSQSQSAGPRPINKRSFHILKEHKDALGEDRLVCKIFGVFYVVVDNAVYTIAFLHSFRVTFMKTTMAK